ncbi:MAG: SspB family protein [Rhizobiaceae bacterium]
MSEDLIRYDILAQDALRGVIRKVLTEVNRTSLPGNHHFFITFVTSAPGVRISTRLHEKYPEQMTIVIQHQYWDLEVSETGFEVTLSFNDVYEKLVIPYSSIRGFYDPSVNFELEFEVKTEPGAAHEPLHIVKDEGVASPAPAATPKTKSTGKPRTPKLVTKKQSEEAPAAAKPSADVVSLDAFRKK